MPATFDRRTLLAFSSLLAAGAALPAAAQPAPANHIRTMTEVPPDAPKVGLLVFPNMVALDLIGPLTVFRILRCDTHLVWKDLAAVPTDAGIAVSPTTDFAGCPEDLDVLFIPGGTIGTNACMTDPEVLEFVADRGSRAKWVTSVCTGSLVLAAAGLLQGYDATSYWAVADLLPLMGARPVDGRVVRDRNRMTGGGVTAGLDFGLTLAAELMGEEAARRVQLVLEYAPEPPFRNGTPDEAGPESTARMKTARAGMDNAARTAAEAAARRLGI
ncbi:DJ-1/PfpI family protein [Paracoccus suum]|uniref:DJ-1/PfpI family protein n=1 Tax=Paracoccus suum TaxID=2259340 RepID=A0A344PMQ2_9RHOB|nr:DJ-1/PfpI family protein [Paracoccus suum]AXC50657.1 DJ-1/PfpI family protein [Paracoccus suum]